jgi:hypothetical protein
LIRSRLVATLGQYSPAAGFVFRAVLGRIIADQAGPGVSMLLSADSAIHRHVRYT